MPKWAEAGGGELERGGGGGAGAGVEIGALAVCVADRFTSRATAVISRSPATNTSVGFTRMRSLIRGSPIQQFAKGSADDRGRFLDEMGQRSRSHRGHPAGRIVAHVRVDQGDFERAPATLELAQAVIVGLAAAQVQPAISLINPGADGRPEHEVVRTTVPVIGIGRTELVNQPPISAVL